MELRDRAMQAARAGFKGIVRLTLATGLVFGLWTLLHLVRRRPLPAPRYTPASLLAAPPAAENGWRDLQVQLGPASPQAPTQFAPVPASALPGSLRAPDLARDLEAMLSSKVPPRPEALQMMMGLIQAQLRQEKTKVALIHYENALLRPRFADDCEVGLGSRCEFFQLLRLHRLEELSVYGDLGGGSWAEAAGRLAPLARADIDAASTARSLLSHMITLSMLEKSVVLADTLAAQTPPGGLFPPDGVSPGAAAAAKLVEVLKGLDPKALNLDQALVAEYLLGRQALVDLEASAEAPLSVLPGRGLLFYDPGRTAEEYDRLFAEQEAFVKDPSRAAPAMVSYHDQTFWWAYNPVGKSVLDGVMLSWESLVKQYTERRVGVLASRDHAVEKLQKLLTH